MVLENICFTLVYALWCRNLTGIIIKRCSVMPHVAFPIHNSFKIRYSCPLEAAVISLMDANCAVKSVFPWGVVTF